MRKLFATAFLTIALGSSVWAQAPGEPRVALSPVPLWPQNGDTSQLPKGQYVFYDPHPGEYVVYYAPESADASSAQPTILRFGTHSLVDPNVTFTVASTGNGRFHYTYNVENGTHARQSIRKVSVLDYSDSSPQGAGANWTVQVEPHNERDLGTPAVSASAIEWTSNSAAPSIAPGSATQGLTVDSTSLPGFVNMAFRGDSKSNEYTPNAVVALPKEVRDQLANVMNPARDLQSAMAIGPRFAKGTSQSTISQNFDFGIQVLVRHKRLNANSPFVQNARKTLESQLQSNDTIQLNSASFDFTNDASTASEKEIANALEMAFAQ
jgi:hypothetical protein